MTGIDALEQWSRELEPFVMMPHYKHVLPYLNDYLKSSGVNSKAHYTVVKLICSVDLLSHYLI